MKKWISGWIFAGAIAAFGCGESTSIEEFEGYGLGMPGSGLPNGGEVLLEKLFVDATLSGAEDVVVNQLHAYQILNFEDNFRYPGTGSCFEFQHPVSFPVQDIPSEAQYVDWGSDIQFTGPGGISKTVPQVIAPEAGLTDNRPSPVRTHKEGNWLYGGPTWQGENFQDLSGSCFAAVGVVAGLGEPAPGVVWLDAHSDFNSPETTLEGYLDGMGLAMLTGGAWQRMVAGVPGAKPVPETAALLVGARDFDEPEKRRLDESAVRLVGPGELRSPEALLAAIEGLEPAPSGLYLHVDLDVLDQAEGRVNVYSAVDGVSVAELIELVGAVLDRHPVRALTLSAYDPDHDPEGRIPPVAMLVLGALAERVGPA